MSSITAGTSAGTALVHTADTSGSLLLKTGASAVTGLTIDASQNVTLANPLPVASGGTGTTSATFVSLTSNVTGTLPVANGGTGLATTPANGALDIGNGTGFTRTTLTGSNGISVTNGAGSITVATNSYIKTDLTKYDSTINVSAAIGTTLYRQWLAVQLTATTEMLIFWGNSTAHAVVWDDTAKVFGTPILVRTAAFSTTSDFAAYSISSTSVLVCSLPGSSTALETVVLTVSGTTITVNTAVATTLAANSILAQTPESSNGLGRIRLVGTTYVLSYSSATPQPCFRAITVSGVVPTIGSELTFAAGSAVSAYASYVYSSSILVHVSASTTVLYAVPISVSGTTLTQGTQATATTSAATLLSGQFSSNRIAAVYFNTNPSASIVSVSGTTASISTVSLSMTATNSNPYMQIFGLQAIVVTNQASVSNQVNVLTDSSGTAVAGTAVNNPIGTTLPWTAFGCDASRIFVQCVSSTRLHYIVCGISGNNPLIISSWPVIGVNTNTGATPQFGQYNAAYANFENGNTLRTAAYKHCTIGTDTTLFAPSFDGTAIPVMQQSVGFYTGSGAAVRSSLNNYSGWISYVNVTAPINTTIYFRRVELA